MKQTMIAVAVAAVYLILSLLTDGWAWTWIIWIFYGIYRITDMVKNRMTNKEKDMFFRKKKEEPAAEPQIKLPGDLHNEWYQTILGVMKTAISQPNCTMTPEQLLEKICPPGMFTEEERTKLLKEATEQ